MNETELISAYGLGELDPEVKEEIYAERATKARGTVKCIVPNCLSEMPRSTGRQLCQFHIRSLSRR